jgi:hypothetical protein
MTTAGQPEVAHFNNSVLFDAVNTARWPVLYRYLLLLQAFTSGAELERIPAVEVIFNNNNQ